MPKKPFDWAAASKRIAEVDFSDPKNWVSDEEFKKFSKDMTAQEEGECVVLPVSPTKLPRKKAKPSALN